MRKHTRRIKDRRTKWRAEMRRHWREDFPFSLVTRRASFLTDKMYARKLRYFASLGLTHIGREPKP
jgi:hypothetical protein